MGTGDKQQKWGIESLFPPDLQSSLQNPLLKDPSSEPADRAEMFVEFQLQTYKVDHRRVCLELRDNSLITGKGR